MALPDATECKIALQNLFSMYAGMRKWNNASYVLSEIKCTQACRGIKGRDSSSLQTLQRESEQMIHKGLSPEIIVPKLETVFVPAMYQSLTWPERMDCVDDNRLPNEGLFAHLRRIFIAAGAACGVPISSQIFFK